MINVLKLTKHPVLYGSGLTALFMLSHLVMDAISGMPGGLLPLLQDRFDLTASSIAVLVATLSFSSSVTQPLFGALSDRFSRRFVAAFGLILNTVLLSLVGVVQTPVLLVVLFFIGGLGSGALHPAGASLVRSSTKGNKGLAVSLFSTAGTAGYALGPVIILYIIAGFGLEITPWFMIPGIVLGVAIYFLTPADDHSPAAGQTKLFDFRVFAGPVGLLSIAGVLGSVAFVTFESALPLWLVAVHGIAPADPLIGWVLAAFTAAAAIGGVAAALISNRISHRWLISGTLLASSLPLFLMFSLKPGTLPFFLTIMAAGALVHASLPLMVVSAQNMAPHATATASGMLMGFGTGIAGILYIGVGQLQEKIGLAAAMQIAYLAVIPAGLLALYVLSRFRTVASDEAAKEPRLFRQLQ